MIGSFFAVTLDRRRRRHHRVSPTIAVIDSKSIPSGHAKSEKGIDGHKKIKGIKRHVAVDSQGLLHVLMLPRRNVHDIKGSANLSRDLKLIYPSISVIKADKGYRGATIGDNVVLQCVKSNFGSSEFKPLNSRRVVERTFAWLGAYRHVVCNYERFLSVARSMTISARPSAGIFRFALRLRSSLRALITNKNLLRA